MVMRKRTTDSTLRQIKCADKSLKKYLRMIPKKTKNSFTVKIGFLRCSPTNKYSVRIDTLNNTTTAEQYKITMGIPIKLGTISRKRIVDKDLVNSKVLNDLLTSKSF
jgi:hypothetical protein